MSLLAPQTILDCTGVSTDQEGSVCIGEAHEGFNIEISAITEVAPGSFTLILYKKERDEDSWVEFDRLTISGAASAETREYTKLTTRPANYYRAVADFGTGTFTFSVSIRADKTGV